MTIDDALDRWMDHLKVERNVSPHTLASYARDLGQLLRSVEPTGATVVVSGRDATKSEAAVAELNAQRAGAASAIACDVTVPDQITALVKQTVDTHGARDQWMCVFVYRIDSETEPAASREAMTITEVYLSEVTRADFRRNERGELGTRTATLGKQGLARFRQSWVYKLDSGSP